MKTLIVEDCGITRDQIESRCLLRPGWEVVGTCELAAEAIHLLERRPDLIILDVGLPDAKGFTVAEKARELLPLSRVLMITGYLNEYVLSRCDRFKVAGFIDKRSVSTAVLDEALQALSDGKTYFTPRYLQARQAWLADPGAVNKHISAAEEKVMSLVVDGLNDPEIAAILGIAANTATTHRSRIMRKLGTNGTPMLMAFGNTHGYGALA